MTQATEQHAAHIQITPVQCIEEDQESALSVPSNDSRGYRSGCEMTAEDDQCHEDYGECAADTSYITESSQSPITSPYASHNTKSFSQYQIFLWCMSAQ